MIPAGNHRVRAVEAALTTKQTGAIGVDVIVETVEGEHAGTRMRHYLHLVNKDGSNSDYAGRVMETLRHLGWRTDDLSDLAGVGDREAIAVVEHKTNPEGKTFAEVKWINALGGGAKIADESRVNGSAAKQLGQRFASLARGVPKVAASSSGTKPTGTKPAQRQTGPMQSDGPDDFAGDDIPFD